MSVQGTRKKVSSKAEINAPVSMNADFFGNKLKVPAHIQKELDEQGLVHRFVSARKLSDNGGYHPMGWTPYVIKNPVENPITGQTDKIYRVGDLILAVKSKEDHAKHRAWLDQKADAMRKSNKNTVQDMRDRIRDSGASKHVSLIEGYDENDDE